MMDPRGSAGPRVRNGERRKAVRPSHGSSSRNEPAHRTALAVLSLTLVLSVCARTHSREQRITAPLIGTVLVYGAMLANLAPVLLDWLHAPTGLIASPIVAGQAAALRWALVIMGVGVFISGVRDTLAVLELPYADWPWRGALKHPTPTES